MKNKEQSVSEAAREQAIEWDMFPLEMIAIDNLPVQALTKRNGLVRGQTYYVQGVHRSGAVWVLGINQPCNMEWFRRERQLPVPAQAEGINATA